MAYVSVASFNKHYFPIVLILVVTLIAIFGSALAPYLRFDQQAILHGELWRLFSCHFVHLTWSHLAMNMAGFILVWILFGQLLSSWEWLLMLIPACLLVSLGLLLFNPDVLWYVGFSGVLHSFIVIACLFDLNNKHMDGKVLLVAVCIKLIYEQFYGPLPGSEATAGGRVIVDAHLYGAIAGLLFAPVVVMLRKINPNTRLQ